MRRGLQAVVMISSLDGLAASLPLVILVRCIMHIRIRKVLYVESVKYPRYRVTYRLEKAIRVFHFIHSSWCGGIFEDSCNQSFVCRCGTSLGRLHTPARGAVCSPTTCTAVLATRQQLEFCNIDRYPCPGVGEEP